MEECSYEGYDYHVSKEVYDFLCDIKKKIIKSNEKELDALSKIINSDDCKQHHVHAYNKLINIPCKRGIIESFTDNQAFNSYTVQYSAPVYKEYSEEEEKENFEEIIKNVDESFKSDLINLGFTGDVSDISFL